MKRSAIPLLLLAMISVGVGAASVVACRGASAPPSPASSASSASDSSVSQAPARSSSAALVASSEPTSAVVDPRPADPAVPPAVAPTTRPSLDQCFALQRKLLAKITAKRAAILLHNAGCKTDGDCVLGAQGGCFPSCGGEAVNTKGEGDLRLTANAADDACKPWRNARCPGVVPIATCSEVRAACVGGRCAATQAR